MTKVFVLDWDEGNRDKNWIKHRVSWKECEEVFNNEPLVQFQDVLHSITEERWIVLGKTNLGRKLHLVFTLRLGKVRVISTRNQNRKERNFYENKTG
ncbi:MAG: BrnT family toxin [Patescibacteria group bacterium]